MSGISASQLARYALRSDVELKVTGQGENALLDENVGTLRGRFVRWLKVNVTDEDRKTKQGEYAAAKEAVRATLRQAYGTDIGDKAYFANIGHWETRNGRPEHSTSSDFPITGRHISAMIKSAEKLILNEEGVQDLGQGFRDYEGNSITEQATAGWMNANQVGQKSITMQEARNVVPNDDRTQQIGLLCCDLRSRAVPNSEEEDPIPDQDVLNPDQNGLIVDQEVPNAEEEPDTKLVGLELGASLAKDLNADIDSWRAEKSLRPGFWTLDLTLDRPLWGSKQHVIGFRVDPGDTDKVVVFDANKCQARLSRANLGGWLGAHLKDTYPTPYEVPLPHHPPSIQQVKLYQAKMEAPDAFRLERGGWNFDQDINVNLDPNTIDGQASLGRFRGEANGKLESCLQGNTPDDLSPGFHADYARQDMQIIRGDGQPPLQLDKQNASKELKDLVRRENEDDGSVRHAAKSASVMLTQAMVTTMYAQSSSKVRVGEAPILLDKVHANRDAVSVRREGDDLYFKYETTPNIRGFTAVDGFAKSQRVSFSDSQIELAMEVKVSIAELEQASRENRPPEFEVTQSPSGQLRFRGYSGEIVTAGL